MRISARTALALALTSLFLAPAGGFPKDGARRPELDEPRPPRLRLPPPPGEMMFWRGRRMRRMDGSFSVRFVRTGLSELGRMRVDMVFGCGIDPRSVRPDRILADGIPLGRGTPFTFSRGGNTVRFFVPVRGSAVSLRVDGILSYDGRPMVPFAADSLGEGCEFRPPRPPEPPVRGADARSR